jgi:hypothetical protein
MTLALVSEWKRIKSAHKQLADPKFKPDLGALLANYVTDYDQHDELQKQREALRSGLLPFIKDMATARRETKAQLEDARQQLVEQFQADYDKFQNDYGDGSDWEGVQKACNAYVTAVKKFIPAVDDCVKKLTKSRDTTSKDEMTGIAQYLTKRKQGWCPLRVA